MNETTKTKIDGMLANDRIFLFMKGTPEFPQCGFSARACAILNELGAKFNSCDVLSNQDVREGIKEYGNWPTIPQLYIDKQLVGGSDIMMEMYETGELKEMLSK